jgi:polyhydroxyalkanoate synthase
MQETNNEIKDVFERVIRVNERIVENYFENFSGYQHDLRDMLSSFNYFNTKILADPKEMVKFQNNYLHFLDKQQKLFTETINRQDGTPSTPIIEPDPEDKRFRAKEWNEEPFFDYIKQSYLLVSENYFFM